MIAVRLPTRWRSTDRRIRELPPVEVTCSGLTAAHDAVDPRPVMVGPNYRRITACRGCLVVIRSLTTVNPDRRR